MPMGMKRNKMSPASKRNKMGSAKKKMSKMKGY